MIVIAALPVVFIKEAHQNHLRDDATVQKRAAGEMISQKTAQRSAKPVCQRDREAFLGQSEQLGGQALRQGGAKKLFAASVLHIPRKRNPHGKFSQLVIEQRATHLE